MPDVKTDATHRNAETNENAPGPCELPALSDLPGRLESRWRLAEELLIGRFGHKKLLPAQRKVIERVLQGENVLAVLPTGHGKSLCFQLPSQILPGLTVVVSPLISLMKDQCDSLRQKGIAAVRIDQSVSPESFRDGWQSIQRGEAKLLYVAPERFFNERFPAQLGAVEISLLAIDEAHCMSQWGHSFRPDYLRLPELVEQFRIGQTLALTATATPIVVRDIRKTFAIDSKNWVRLSSHRANLRIHCTPVRTDTRDAVLIDRLCGGDASSGSATSRSGTPKTKRSKRSKRPTIIYVTRRNTAEQLAETLSEAGFEPMVYHAGLSAEQREAVQREFLAGTDSILIGTIAFGMGVDKPDIRNVIHYNPSQSIESFSQEIGRGGRDGRACDCETLLVPEDQVSLMNLAASDLPSDASLVALLERLTGQPATFHLALGKLGWEINLSTQAVAATLLRLQTAGYLRCLPMRYDAYRITPMFTNQTTIDRCAEDHREAVTAVLASLSKGKRGFRINLVVAANQYGIDRDRLLAAIEQSAIAGLWNVTSLDSMHGYEWAKPITRPKSVINAIRKHAFEQFERSGDRVRGMMDFLAGGQCYGIALAEHFGSRRSRGCGRCSVCLGRGPFVTEITRLDSIGRSAVSSLENAVGDYPDLFSEPLDQAKFLCGLSTPFFRRHRLARHPGYGVCEDVPFERVLTSLTPSPTQKPLL